MCDLHPPMVFYLKHFQLHFKSVCDAYYLLEDTISSKNGHGIISTFLRLLQINNDNWNAMMNYKAKIQDCCGKRGFHIVCCMNYYELAHEACRNKEKWAKKTGLATELHYSTVDGSREASGVWRLHWTFFALVEERNS